jgi:hypothetical protein
VRSAYGEYRFRRGDANADGRVDISDAIRILGYLFLGRQGMACDSAADADDSGSLDISDPIRILVHLFLSAAPPPAPGPERCGADPTKDALPCDVSTCF